MAWWGFYFAIKSLTGVDEASGSNSVTAKSSANSFWLYVKVITNGHDAASHSGGRGTNRSGGRDRHDGPTHAHAHAHARL